MALREGEGCTLSIAGHPVDLCAACVRCRSWFDKSMSDGLIERVLPVVPDAGKLVPYTFIVHTSDMKGAGTDAGGRQGSRGQQLVCQSRSIV